MGRVSDTALVRSANLLDEELDEPGGSIDAFEDEGAGTSWPG
jgi:hypothetical protein